MELGTLEDKLKELKDLEAPLLARFNALLNRETFKQVAIPESVLEAFPDKSIRRALALDQQALEAQLSQNNPDLLYVDALIEARNSGI